jgi:hypothetical protein
MNYLQSYKLFESRFKDIERVVKFIENKSNISESFTNRKVSQEYIQDLFVDMIDLGFDPVLQFSEEFLPPGFRVVLTKLESGDITLDDIYDTLEISEEYIL